MPFFYSLNVSLAGNISRSPATRRGAVPPFAKPPRRCAESTAGQARLGLHCNLNRHDRLFHPAAPGDLHRPGLEPRPFLRMQHARKRPVRAALRM